MQTKDDMAEGVRHVQQKQEGRMYCDILYELYVSEGRYGSR